MKCECNYHLGMGPNLLCPVHGNPKPKKNSSQDVRTQIRELAKTIVKEVIHVDATPTELRCQQHAQKILDILPDPAIIQNSGDGS